jgi:hypothetical protein
MVERRKAVIIGAAVTAGVVAAGVVYLLYVRPQWRRYVVEAGHHVLNITESLVKRGS